jgi:hypothetical protein
MRRTLPLAIALFITACVPHTLTAPAPVQFHTPRSPNDVTRSAAIVLVDAGFRVAQSDSAGLALSAARTATHNGNAEFVSCSLPSGSAAAVNRETTLTISFKATPAPSGTAVTIASSVRTAFPGYEGTSIEVPPGDTLCVSNGTMERRLEAALR